MRGNFRPRHATGERRAAFSLVVGLFIHNLLPFFGFSQKETRSWKGGRRRRRKISRCEGRRGRNILISLLLQDPLYSSFIHLRPLRVSLCRSFREWNNSMCNDNWQPVSNGDMAFYKLPVCKGSNWLPIRLSTNLANTSQLPWRVKELIMRLLQTR